MNREKGLGVVVLTSMVVVVGSCGGEGAPAAGTFEAVDSAGIRVVHNTGASWEPGEAWLVEAEPEWSLGELDGPPEVRFFRIGDIVLRSDGGVVVADAGSAEVRAFDADGTHLWTQGRDGDGPGEYRVPGTLVILPDDSVAVYDTRARRVTVVGPDGEFARSFVPGVPEGYASSAPRFAVAPGRWVAAAGMPLGEDLPASATLSRPWSLFWARPDRTVLDSVTSLSSGARLIQQTGAGVGIWTVPFSIDARAAGGGGRLVTAEPDTPVWTARDSTGSVVQVVSFPAESRPVRDADWAAALEAALPEGADAGRRQAVTAAYEAMDRPSEWPLFQDLLVDEAGQVWIEGFQPPGSPEQPSRWWVFTGEGRLLGRISLPAGLEVHGIQGDRVVGVARDEFDVERIQVHRLRRPG